MIQLALKSILILLLFSIQDMYAHAWQNWNSDNWNNIKGPGGRKGHSIVLYNESKIIVFGGRDNDIQRSHRPIKSNDFLSDIISINNKESRTYPSSSLDIPVGLYYNDIWMYDINCKERYGDLECQDSGWNVLHPGESFGGCRYDNNDGIRICNIPSERWEHQAVMINEYLMLIYGM